MTKRRSRSWFRFLIRFSWFTRIWYGLTVRLTRLHGHKLGRIQSPLEIPALLGFGGRYKEDPLHGRFDVMYHPSKVQKWIDEGRKVGDCLPADTLLLRSDGQLVPIESIEEGDMIHDGSGWVTVERKFDPSYKAVRVLALNNGSVLRASADHRLFDSAGNEVLAGEVSIGARLLQPDANFASGMETLSTEDATFLAAYVAEGWSEKRPVRVGISGVEGSKGIREFVIELCERHGWRFTTAKRYVRLYPPKEHAVWRWIASMGERALGKRLLHVGFSKETSSVLFETLMRTDGTYGGREKDIPVYGTISEVLALQVRVLARILGKSTHIKKTLQHGGFGKNPIYRVTVRVGDDARKRFAKVVGITEEPVQRCYDITTSSGRIYLPEADVIVHNCDDHAIYWAAHLLKSEIALKVWIGVLFFQQPNGKIEGHAVSVYVSKDGVQWWGDYSYPLRCTSQWDWAHQSATIFNSKLISAAMIHVRSVDVHDTPKFGSSQHYVPVSV